MLNLKKLGIYKIDLYIIKKFLTTYIFLITIIITIGIIFDFNTNIDRLTQSNATTKQIVFDYYFNFIPYFTNLFSPLFVFISVIFFTTKLADNSEIIAMKSTGMSFKRLLRPYMISAGIIALTTFLLGAYVIPKGNIAKNDFYITYIKKRNTTVAENIQMQVDTGVVAYITRFDNVRKSGYGFSLDKFKDKKLVSHLTAQTLQYDTLAERPFSWTLRNYHIRTMINGKEEIKSGAVIDTIIMMEPKDFFYVKGQQETLTLPELEDFIEKQKLRGAAGIATFEVEYHKRFASPFAAFILTLIGASLSSEKRKGGMGFSIGTGIALSFTYIMFQTIFATFAINAGWSAMISVWIPNIIFAGIAFWLYKRAPQ
jgi:lipopolysaccharide export system permease protein